MTKPEFRFGKVNRNYGLVMKQTRIMVYQPHNLVTEYCLFHTVHWRQQQKQTVYRLGGLVHVMENEDVYEK